jgi:hypothetical protein
MPKTRGGVRPYRLGGISPSFLQMLDRRADCGPESIAQTLAAAFAAAFVPYVWQADFESIHCFVPLLERAGVVLSRPRSRRHRAAGAKDALRVRPLLEAGLPFFLGDKNCRNFWGPRSDEGITQTVNVPAGPVPGERVFDHYQQRQLPIFVALRV